VNEVFDIMERTQQLTNALKTRLNEVFGAEGHSRELYERLLGMKKVALVAEAQARNLLEHCAWQVRGRQYRWRGPPSRCLCCAGGARHRLSAARGTTHPPAR
jgi:hypothetical protein